VRLLGPVRDYVKSSGCAPTNKLKEADLPVARRRLTSS
jgi:hypothetical protein